MKFDKDTLVKHRFWLLTALSVPLALAALLMLLANTTASQEQQKFREKLKLKPSEIKTPGDIERVEKEAEASIKEETKLWGDAYKLQEPVSTWTKLIEEKYQFANGLVARSVESMKEPAKGEEGPKDIDNELLHGKVVEVEPFEKNWFKVRDQKGVVHQFFRYSDDKMPLTLKDGEAEQKLKHEQLPMFKDKFVAVRYQKGKYFNDPLTTYERIDYAKSYESQIRPLLESVNPLRVNDKGEPSGVVQFREWPYNDKELPMKRLPKPGFIRYVDGWVTNHDFSAEAWIAQEDLWIQNEIYRLVRVANDSVSHFKSTGRDAKNGTQLYANAYFNLALKLVDGEHLQVKIGNRLNRRQKLDIKLLIKFGDALPDEEVNVPGKALAPKGINDGKENVDWLEQVIDLPAGVQRQAIKGVEQMLTWETAAVRRIDVITIGSSDPSEFAHGHRTFPEGLKPYKKKEDEAPAKKVDDKQPMPSGPGSKVGGPANPFGQVGGNGGGANEEMLPNGVWTNRYVEVSAQSRRIPVGIALIVDQDHIDRVLTTFNNSKLRFLMTQLLMNHYPRSLKPAAADKADENKGGFNPGFGPAGGLGSLGPLGPRFGPMGPMGPVGPMGNGGNGGQAIATGQDAETNIELVMYGVMTLYERYPPRAAALSTEEKK